MQAWYGLRSADFAALDAAQTVALLPVAAVEQHGPHLPLGVDAMLLEGILAAAQPRYVLFSTGYRNRFGYPRPETVARYQTTGAALLNASDEGALTFRLEPGRSLEPERYRREYRHYWTAP